tara:strand:+ start:280 stop:534 length:255 start_codon:yes stop_codon:yes gene_type:complete
LLLQEISLAIRLAVTGINKAADFCRWLPTIQSYSGLILNLSLPILCEASLNALGWDVGLLGQRSYSNTKRRMSIVLQFLRAIYQ